MNNPPIAPKDRQQLPDTPQAQRVPVQSPAVGASVPAQSQVSQIPSFSLQGGLPPGVAMADISTLNKMSQLGGNAPVFLVPLQPKLDPMNLLGTAAAVQQQQQIQNAGILRSLREQKEQISKYEDEIRRRMMLPPSDPLLQAHLVQNDPGRFLGAMGLMGSMGPGLLNPTRPPALATTQLPLPTGDNRLRGGVVEPFPEKLHRLLQETEAAGLTDIISFVANGRAFRIHKPERFFKEIVPRYFRHKRLSSFKRQLNLYGFELISSGPSRGAYFHKSFLKGKPELCVTMRRSVTSKAYSKTQEPKSELPVDTPASPTSSDPKEAPSNEEASSNGEGKEAPSNGEGRDPKDDQTSTTQTQAESS